MVPLFQPPEGPVLSDLLDRFPCREPQIRALAALLHPGAAPCRNLIVYGAEATGKSAITQALLERLAETPVDPGGQAPHFGFAVVNSRESITGRHLLEMTVGRAANALNWDNVPPRCESISQLAVELSKMLKYACRPDGFRFVLVFDGIDRQRESPPTLQAALARLSEIIPCLTVVFIVTSPPTNFLRTSFVPYIQFPNYTKAEFVRILSMERPQNLPAISGEEASELWTRFCGAVHDALIKAAARTLPALRHACAALWPRFTAPVLAGTHGPREFSKLLIAARAHFQDESLLDPGIVSNPTMPQKLGAGTATAGANGPSKVAKTAGTADLADLLPTTARLLLLAAYLASHNAARHDLALFSTYHHGRRRRRGGLSAGTRIGRGGARSKHRRIARKLLGAHAFVLERMMAIFASVRSEWDERAPTKRGVVGSAMDTDVGMALATLTSLRLLVRVGIGGDPMDRGGKWRVNVGWEIIRGLGRSIGIEVEEWLIE